MEKIDVNIKFLVPLLCFSIFIYGIYSYVNYQETNACEMTYMFEYPEYLPIQMKHDVTMKFPRYKLYVYGEGKYFQDLKQGHISGVPVLFVPGNAGSHRQVRSLASVALRMGYFLHDKLRFNFFTIDFNEELSGLYGGILKDQTEFVAASIDHIRSLYSTKMKVVLIGHSMGGVVSAAVFSLASFDPGTISLLYTLAAPLKQPVLNLDSAIESFYWDVDKVWRRLYDTTVISIGGGQKDILVRSDLTNIPYKGPRSIHALMTSVPGVWLSTDHLAITWCKQLILTICRSLFHLLDKRTKQPWSSESLVSYALSQHFVSRVPGDATTVVPTRLFTSAGQWIEQESRAWRFSRTKVLSTLHLLIPVTQGDDILVTASGLVKREWVYGCTKLSLSEVKTCTEGENLSEMSELIPSKNKKYDRRIIHLGQELLRRKAYYYILVYIPPLDSQVELIGDRYSVEDRRKEVILPLAVRPFVSPVRLLSVSLAEEMVFYNISLSRAAGVFEAAEIRLETRLCRAGSQVGQGFIKMTASETSYHHIKTSLGAVTVIPIWSYTPKEVTLELYLDPECSILLTAHFPLYTLATQFVKFYGVNMIGYTVALLLAIFAGQMHCYESTGVFLSFGKLFGYYPTYVSLVAVPSVIYHTLLSKDLSLPLIPYADRFEGGLVVSFCIRTLLYFCACGFLYILYNAVAILLGASACIIMWRRDSVMMGVTKVPLDQACQPPLRVGGAVWAAFLASLALTLASSVALALAAATHLIRLVRCHLRCCAEVERRGVRGITTQWRVHLSLCLMWAIAVCLIVPSAITWYRSLEFSLRVPGDPHLASTLVLLVASGALWCLPATPTARMGYKQASYVVHVVASVTALYAIQSLYRLLECVAITSFIFALQQLYAFKQSAMKFK